MSLDFNYTCTAIDNSIKEYIDNIKSNLDNMLNEGCSMLDGEDRENFINTYANYIYEDFENSFETVRKTNEDMRKQADEQIDNLEKELKESNYMINELESEVNSLGQQLNEIEY